MPYISVQSDSSDKDDEKIEDLVITLVNQNKLTEYMFESEEEFHGFYDK